jgi:hypothetical protein
MKQFLLFIAFLALSFNLKAYDFVADGIYYNITSTTTVSVTYATTSYNSYSGSVTIPSSITYSSTSYSVTSVGNYAFLNCTGLTSITIPSSVTSIGNDAFYNCTGLTSITIPSSVTSIGSWVFCNTGLTSITIPSSVTSIGSYAFCGCTGLTSITIPSSVTSIGVSAFFNCIGLTSIIVDDSNTTYSSSDGVLFNKNKSTLICYPAGKTGTTYTILSSVTSIGGSAFSCCTGLTSITIPSSVTSIGSYAFSNCTGLTSIYVYYTSPLTLSSSSYIFLNVPQTTCILYVPAGTKALYTAATVWQDFSNIVEMSSTDVNTLNGESSISLCPNPVKENLTITGLSQPSVMYIYTINGKLIKQTEVTNNSYNVSDLKAGIYIVKLLNNNRVIYNGKIVKE